MASILTQSLAYARERYTFLKRVPDQEFQAIQRAIPFPAYTADIRDFGPVGGGNHDDSSPFQQALRQVGTVGGALNVPPEIYVAGDLEMYANTSMVGGGWGTKIKKLPGSTYLVSVNPGTGGSADVDENASQLGLFNLWMEGLSTTPGYGFSEHHHLINWNAVSDAWVVGCKLTAFEGDGVFLGSGNVENTERHNERVRLLGNYIDGVNKMNRNGTSVIDGTDIWALWNYYTRCAKETTDALGRAMPGAFDIEPDGFAFMRVRNIYVGANEFVDIGGNAGAVTLQLPLAQSVMTTPMSGLYLWGNTIRTARSVGFLFQQEENKDASSVANVIRLADNTVTDTGRGLQLEGIKDFDSSGDTFDTTAQEPLIGTNYTCKDITFRRPVFRKTKTVCYANVANLTFERGLWDDPTSTAGVDALTGTSDHVAFDDCEWRTPTGTMTVAIQKEAGHTTDITTNRIRRPNFNGLASNFVGVGEFVGSGTPQGVVKAAIGSTFQRTDGGAGTTLYVKESGTSDTGWVGK